MAKNNWAGSIEMYTEFISQLRSEVEEEVGVSNLGYAELRFNLFEACCHLMKAAENLKQAKEGRNGLTQHNNGKPE